MGFRLVLIEIASARDEQKWAKKAREIDGIGRACTQLFSVRFGILIVGVRQDLGRITIIAGK
jgi:hypothetical protein